jgi:hypothetical protein
MSQSGLAVWRYAASSASTIVLPDPANPWTRWLGNYHDTTGKLVFTKLIKELYGCGAGPTAALAFAGTFTELVVVRSAFPPLLLIQRVEHGWWAVHILSQ